jgi:serine/threonine protein kinase
MDQLRERYSFDEKDCLGGLFEDAGIRNASYRAIRNRDGKEVQIVVYKSAKPGQISSYWKKINKFAEVQHFNLTPILECTQDAEENMLFIVLEWTQGYSLKEFLGDGVLNWRAAYFIIKDVLSGLSELHKAGLVYSFINLENIEIFEGRGRLSFRYLIYKTYYLSPEVKENHQKSRESDLFSIGVCLFRLIFGALPFKAKSPAEFVKSVKAGVAKRLPIENTFFPKIVPT